MGGQALVRNGKSHFPQPQEIKAEEDRLGNACVTEGRKQRRRSRRAEKPDCAPAHAGARANSCLTKKENCAGDQIKADGVARFAAGAGRHGTFEA